MSYEVYKVIHIVFIFYFLTGMAISFFKKETPKGVKIFTGIASFLILVGGMGLMARVGISHGKGWPLWIKMKFLFWGILAIGGPILAKRLKEKRELAFYGLMLFAVFAAFFAIYQPQ